MDHEMASHALGVKAKKEKPLKSFHVRELHDGTHHVEKNDGKGNMEEASAKKMKEVHQMLEAHMGKPAAAPMNEVEGEQSEPEPQMEAENPVA